MMKKVALLLAFTALSAAHAQDAVRIDSENPKYLWFRGKPLVLISASEHYGSVINRPFDYEKYLADAAQHRMTMTRTFLLYRELQSARNPSSPCKPESPDYLSPFVRSGPAKAMDGEPIYDLDQWNSEYFERLHRFLDLASKDGIVVELTVFSNTYANDVWALNPLRAENNIQHVGTVDWEDYISLKNPQLVRRQSAYARKIIQETAGYDNVYYEICNEPGGGIAGHASSADVDAWQEEMARVMRDEMQRLKRPHLLSGAAGLHLWREECLPPGCNFLQQDLRYCEWPSVTEHTIRRPSVWRLHVQRVAARSGCGFLPGYRSPPQAGGARRRQYRKHVSRYDRVDHSPQARLGRPAERMPLRLH